MSVIDVDPGILLTSPPPVRRHAHIAYLSNLWYGHQAALLAHAGMPDDAPIMGKVENGWQAGTGFDGEQAWKLEVQSQRLPCFAWGRRQLYNALSHGMEWAVAIGAPFLYANLGAAPAQAPCGLLVIPSHSAQYDSYQVAGWREFGARVIDFARSEGFPRVTVCLHPNDYARADAQAAIRAAEVETTCAGGLFYEGFLARMADLIRVHEAVASDRIMSAAFYAQVLDRPFRILPGDALVRQPLDPEDQYSREWAEREFPQYLAGWRVDRYTALRELGAPFLRQSEELRALLCGQAGVNPTVGQS